MDRQSFEEEMRVREVLSHVRAAQNEFIILRMDGRGFSTLTDRLGFEKPFDIALSYAMLSTATAVLKEFNGVYGYTQSDEISVLLPRETSLFSRRLEKLVTVAASHATASFNGLMRHYDDSATFDGRVWLARSVDEVVDCFRWRQEDAKRNALHSWAYWTLRKEGLSARAATSELKGKRTIEKVSMLQQRGIQYFDVPAWQKNGFGVHWVNVDRLGHNPITNTTTTTSRRQLEVLADLPTGDDYAMMLRGLIQ